MIKTIILFIFAFPLTAQSLWGVYVSGFPTTSPKPSFSAFYATEISQQQKLWSYTEYHLIRDGNHFITTSTTGLTTPIRSVRTCSIFVLGTSGMATNGSGISGSFSAGGFIDCPQGRNHWLAGYEKIAGSIGQNTLVAVGWAR